LRAAMAPAQGCGMTPGAPGEAEEERDLRAGRAGRRRGRRCAGTPSAGRPAARAAPRPTRQVVPVQTEQAPCKYVSVEGPASFGDVDFDRDLRPLARRYLTSARKWPTSTCRRPRQSASARARCSFACTRSAGRVWTTRRWSSRPVERGMASKWTGPDRKPTAPRLLRPERAAAAGAVSTFRATVRGPGCPRAS